MAKDRAKMDGICNKEAVQVGMCRPSGYVFESCALVIGGG